MVMDEATSVMQRPSSNFVKPDGSKFGVDFIRTHCQILTLAVSDRASNTTGSHVLEGNR